MQSAIFANKAFFVVLIAPVRRTIGVYSEPSFFDHFTVCRQMILIRDVVDRIDLKRYFGEVVSADFAIVEIEHLIRENINGLLLIQSSRKDGHICSEKIGECGHSESFFFGYGFLGTAILFCAAVGVGFGYIENGITGK